MLGRLTQVVVRARWLVVCACGLAAIGAGLLGRGLFSRLAYTEFDDPRTESARGAALAQKAFGHSAPDLIALYQLPKGFAPAAGVNDPAVRQAIAQLVDRLGRDPAVARVNAMTGRAGAPLVSRDRRKTFVVVSLRGSPREKLATRARLQPLLALELPSVTGSAPARITPLLGGLVQSGRALTQLAERSFERGERIALPVTGVLLVIIFGSVVAAALPLALGGLSIVLALGALELLSHLTPIDAFAVNVVTILGLGVAIDYALFLVSRYREELARTGGTGPPDAARRRRALTIAVGTAGRSVLFSGLTVAVNLAGLLFFGQPIFRSVAFGGIAVVLLAALLALLVLPALLAILGGALERGRIPWLARPARRARKSRRFWRRWAGAVTKRPLPVCVAVTVVLILLALPFGRIKPSRADVRALPSGSEPREVANQIARDFPLASIQPISIVVETNGDLLEGDRLGALYDYTSRLATVPGVSRVDSVLSHAQARDRAQAIALAPALENFLATEPKSVEPGLGSVVQGRYTLVQVIANAPSESPEALRVVNAIRRQPPPPGGAALVFGAAASLADFNAGVRAGAPWMLGFVAAAMFAVLLIAFRSLVLPIKAMVMTALSLTASFGAMVFIFQDGRFQHLLAYQSLGTIDATLPVMMFAVVFGLSMDYEVLILGRIREELSRSGDNRQAIAAGLARTGGLVTSAALLMVVVFASFAAAPVVYVKALGLGMALAIALDATVVRMLLVPSTMALLGRLNWWAPGRLGRPTTPE